MSEETIDGLVRRASAMGGDLRWAFPFVLPPWMKAWWEAFGEGWEPCVLFVERAGRPIGIAPLRVRGGEARFLGEVNVCDYLDFVVAPGREETFLTAVLGHLQGQGIRRLDLRVLRPDSVGARFLAEPAADLPCDTRLEPEDVTCELALPSAWEAYLHGLSGHQRHEVRRKLRRVQDAGEVRMRVVDEPEGLRDRLDPFLDLFRSSSPQKAEFLTPVMVGFFRSVLQALVGRGMVRLHFLELDGTPAAAALCLEHGDTTYLYNSGYDHRFASLGVGWVCKVLTIRDSIERGRRTFDFLKGAERYKEHLGGTPVPLYRARVTLT